MKVPYQLHWQPASPAAALLYDGDAAGLLRLCARLGGAGLPSIHATGGGFLVRLQNASREVAAAEADACPGAVRLRSLAEGIYLPVDAGLSPALLPEEAQALGRRGGLIFLPGGRVLTFDPAARLGPADLLTLPRLPPRDWRPLPDRPRRPAELTGIVLDLPPESEPDALGEAGRQIGGGAARPPKSGAAGSAAGRVLGGLGQGLGRLGEALDSERLRQMAARLLQLAMRQAPQLTEKLLGKHESALRELLRRFREGHIDDALRHAVPVSDEPGRGNELDEDPHLVPRDFRWSPSDLLASGGGGRAWVGREDLLRQLREQYARAAEAAARAGDYLRAAAIHGKLLGDWRAAAALLERAGRHHDAARIYLDKLQDNVSAARAYEAAGEIDRAVELHVRHGRFLEAADLLRRAGEPDRATPLYLRAARQHAHQGNYAAAARLLTGRAGAPELAEPFLCQGWKGRPSDDAVECLQDLAAAYLGSGRDAPLRQLLDEADAHFAPPGGDASAARFYNRLVEHYPQREDLRDRALSGLANKLRQRAGERDRGAGVLSLLFAQGAWESSLVRDAEFALRGAARPAPAAARTASRRVKIHAAEVLTVAQAGVDGGLVLGFADGCVARYDPVEDRTTKLTTHGGSVVSVAYGPHADQILLVRQGMGKQVLAAYEVHPEAWISTLTRPLPALRDDSHRLTSIVRGNDGTAVGLYSAHSLQVLSSIYFDPGPSLHFQEAVVNAFVVPAGDSWSVLALHQNSDASAHRFVGDRWHPQGVPYAIAYSNPSPENLPPSLLFWPQGERTRVELAWSNDSQEFRWACLELGEDLLRLETDWLPEEGCTCAALLDAGRFAAVHARGVAWLRSGQHAVVYERTGVELPEAVAAFASPRTGELLVVTRYGDLIRVPLPG